MVESTIQLQKPSVRDRTGEFKKAKERHLQITDPSKRFQPKSNLLRFANDAASMAELSTDAKVSPQSSDDVNFSSFKSAGAKAF